MKNGLKIFLCTLGTLLVLALAGFIFWLTNGRTPQYETVDAHYEPVSATAMPAAADISETVTTPEPTTVPTPEAAADKTTETTEADGTTGTTGTTETTETTETASETAEEPTADEDGFYPCDDQVSVTGDSVNIRSEPNTNCEVLGSVSRGASLHRTGFNDDNWCRIEYNGSTAYISGDYVSVE